MVEEAYEFDEDSEELDMLVEDEILEEGAEFEEEIEMEETPEELGEAEMEPEEASWEEEPIEAAQEALGAVQLSDEKLDMIVNEITQRVAGKLAPILMQELAKSFMQIPMVKNALEETSKNMVKDLLPEIRKNL
jgi:hypothetical protein